MERLVMINRVLCRDYIPPCNIEHFSYFRTFQHHFHGMFYFSVKLISIISGTLNARQSRLFSNNTFRCYPQNSITNRTEIKRIHGLKKVKVSCFLPFPDKNESLIFSVSIKIKISAEIKTSQSRAF